MIKGLSSAPSLDVKTSTASDTVQRGASSNRPLRVLHIGNIANNAYLNSKFLRAAGVEADVLCYDYYHIMGCPEWEEANFEPEGINQSHPDWRAVPFIAPFERPDWFAQGPFAMAVDYLLAYRRGDAERAQTLKRALQTFNLSGDSQTEGVVESSPSAHSDRGNPPQELTPPAPIGRLIIKLPLRRLLQQAPALMRALISGSRHKGPAKFLSAATVFSMSLGAAFVRTMAWRIRAGFGKILGVPMGPPGARAAEGMFRGAKRLTRSNRVDLRVDDIVPLAAVADTNFEALLNYYDIVHAYATDGILPLLFNKPYVAYEHGTIRYIPFEQTSQGRRCAAAYQLADAVIITNADNVVAASRLQLARYFFVPHPVNDFAIDALLAQSAEISKNLHQKLGSDFIVFHPSRQHWEERRHPDWEKGNDFFLRGFARFVREQSSDAKAILIDWGSSVGESRRLIDQLGIAGNVIWEAPMPHVKMAERILGADVLADQFFLGAFGSTLPKALACGRPALIYLNDALHKWCFSEMPPVANVRTEDEIFSALSRLYSDELYYKQMAEAGRSWYMRHHSSKVVVDRLQAAYADVLTRDQALENV